MTLAATVITPEFAVLGADDLLAAGDPPAFQLKLWPAGRLGWMAWAGDAAFGFVALAYLNAFQTVEDRIQLLGEESARVTLKSVLERSASDLVEGINGPARWLFEDHVELVNSALGSFRIPETRVSLVGSRPDGTESGYWRLDLHFRDQSPSQAGVDIDITVVSEADRRSAKLLYSGDGYDPKPAEDQILDASTSIASAKTAIIDVIQARSLEEREGNLPSRVSDSGHVLSMSAAGILLERFTATGDLTQVAAPLNEFPV